MTKKTQAQKVIVRTYSSGVHYAEIGEYNPQFGTATLKNARRLWRWYVKDSKGLTLTEVALYGLESKSRVSDVMPEMRISEVIEILPCSAEAVAAIDAVEVAKP